MKFLILLAAAGCSVLSSDGATLNLTTTRTLSGSEVEGKPMTMTLATDDTHLVVRFAAPYHSGPNSSVHLFLADNNHKLTELEFTPSANTLRMYWAPYNVFRTLPAGDAQDAARSFAARTSVNDDMTAWSGQAKVHRDFLPPRITLVNAAYVHPADDAGGELQYDNLYTITNHGIALPDLMVLARYKAIGARFLFNSDDGYSNEWSSTN